MITKGRNKLGHADSNIIIWVDNLERTYPGNFIILETYRDKERQNMLNKKDKTQVRFPNSKHNKYPSKAIDLLPLQSNNEVDWNDRELLTLFAGYGLAVAKMKNIQIRWGGDWDRDSELKDNKFDDLYHYEVY